MTPAASGPTRGQSRFPEDAGDVEWLEAAKRRGKVLVINGDYLEIAETGLNMDAAARLGTLVTGNVPFVA